MNFIAAWTRDYFDRSSIVNYIKRQPHLSAFRDHPTNPTDHHDWVTLARFPGLRNEGNTCFRNVILQVSIDVVLSLRIDASYVGL